jgi:hypothetical protein
MAVAPITRLGKGVIMPIRLAGGGRSGWAPKIAEALREIPRKTVCLDQELMKLP